MDPVFLVGGLIYVAVFWALSWRYPAVALALVFGLAPFQNDLSGGVGGVKFSLSEVHLVLGLPIVILMLARGEKQLRTWPFLGACALYFGVCAASGLVQWRGGAALTSLFQMVLFFFVLIPVFSVLARRPQQLMPALWTLLGVSTFLAGAVLVTRSQYIFSIHKNGIGGSLACGFLVAFELWFHYRARASWHKGAVLVLMAVIAAGLLLTVSRGAWIGAICGTVFIAAMRRQVHLLGRIALVLVPVLAVGWMLLPPDARAYAFDFNPERGNIEARLKNQEQASALFESSPLLGAGIGLRKQYDATQIVLFTLAETGILGLASFALIFVAFFGMVWRTQARLARTEFTYSLLSIGGALMVARLGHSMVDHYWARGPTMMAWAAAGMATGVYLYGPKGSYAGRLRRARALLALHLIEMRRRQKRGQNVPRLSQAELRHANEALTLVGGRGRAGTNALLHEPNSAARPQESENTPNGTRQPLREMARHSGNP